jgi:type 1 glutamine amidotransferase
MRQSTLTLLAFSSLFATAQTEPSSVEPIRVLYVTGGGYHDYRGQERIVTEGLSARANIEWTVDFEAGNSNNHQLTRFEDPDWHQAFDAVIYNMCFAGVTDVEYIERFTWDHYESGTAALVLHCAMHSFRDAETDQWNRLIGLESYHHEREQRPIEIQSLGQDHPAMIGFPSTWVSPRDELYIVRETYPNLTPLTLAYGEETQRHHIVMWANQYGQARVIGTSAGHNNAVIADSVFLDFLARGLLWTVDRIQPDGRPQAGYEGTGNTPSFEIENYQPEPSARLTGTPIGTEGAWGNGNRTKHRALDGNINTFFDAPAADGAWVGLDLGSAHVLTAVRLAPRANHEDRLSGGKIQGANRPDFSDATDLHTIDWISGHQIVGRRIENENAFRYVRFLSPDGGHGNLSLLEFFGP